MGRCSRCGEWDTLSAKHHEPNQHKANDAAAFLDPDAPPRSVAVVCPALHGSRCLLIEVQALVAQGSFGQARRSANGLDGSHLTMLTAVLEQHAH